MAAGAREHRLEPGDTLPGLALRYGVTPHSQMEQIKRANRLYTSDTIFLKPTLLIPAAASRMGDPDPSDPPDGNRVPSRATGVPPTSRHDLSATDFLRQLDADIGRSKAAAAAQQLRVGSDEAEGSRSPDPGVPAAPRGPRLGPCPLTKTPRAAALREAEDDIFTL